MNLGKGFTDSVRGGRGFRRYRSNGFRRVRDRFSEGRMGVLFFLFVFGMVVLAGKLFWVSVLRGSYYRKLSEENRIREEVLWAPRGIVYDRNGEALVHNRPVYRTYRTDKTYRYFTQEEVLRLEAEGKAGQIEEFISREYPYGEAFAHVLGYVGEADKEDVKKGKKLGSLVGKSGLEESFDEVLRGKNGKVLVETDAVGNKTGELGRVDAEAGEDLYTTIDKNLQIAVEKAMGNTRMDSNELELQEDGIDTGGVWEDSGSGKAGAVVVSTPEGEILALYSGPGFDPNIFVGSGKWEVGNGNSEVRSEIEDIKASKHQSIKSSSAQEILESPTRPLFNRAVGGLYPPGSVFKPVVAVAGLEEGAIDKNTIFIDKGIISIGPYKYRNWYYTQYGRVEGEVDIIKAIARSVDTYFYKAGEKIGIDAIAEWGRKFGIGEKSGIEIAGEAEGRMPDREWKEENRGDRWYLGDTYHVSIGQGDILVTPLQVNLMTGAIANRGRLCKPKLVKNGGDLQVLAAEDEGNAENCSDLGISRETLNLVVEGMKGACEPGGTGFEFFEFKVQGSRFEGVGDGRIPVACKTGTAEFGSREETHAWFTVFAPVEKPEVVVTVLLEKGGSGAYDAAPVAKKILKAYFVNKGD